MIVYKDGYKVLVTTSDVVCFIFRKLLCLSRISCAKITSFFTLSLLICFETVLLSAVSDCSKTFTVSWNTSNPIFRQDNDGHIIHVNKGNTQFEYDQVNIVCPNYTPGTHEDDGEKYIIYNVSKEEYETCRITNPIPRIIAVCDKPHTMLYYTITFRPFTPQPGGLEFPPGHDYYFISTSSKDDLHRRIGGRCQSHNMKVIFKVCCKAEDYNYDVPSKNHGASEPTIATSPRVFTPRIRLTTPTSVPPYYQGKTTNAPDSSVQQPSFNKPSKKKPNDNQNHPNEIVKNEELTHSTSLSIGMVTSSVFFVQVIAIVSFLVTFFN